MKVFLSANNKDKKYVKFNEKLRKNNKKNFV